MNAHTPYSGTDTDLPLQVREYSIYPLAEAAGFGVAVFIAIFLTTYFIYHHALNAQKGEIKQGLVRTGAVLASFIDGDLQKQFTSRDQESTDLYNTALEPLKKHWSRIPALHLFIQRF